MYFADHNMTANFEARLYENDPNKRFDFVFGTVQPGQRPIVCFWCAGTEQRLYAGLLRRTSGRRLAHLHLRGGGGSPTPTPTTVHRVAARSMGLSTPAIPHRLIGCSATVFPASVQAPKVCPGVLGDGLPRHYDSHTFTNTTGSTQCVTVDMDAMTCTGTNFIFFQAYLGSFDPTNLCTNYLADSGSSPNPTASFSFNLDDGQTVVIVVSEVDSGRRMRGL